MTRNLPGENPKTQSPERLSRPSPRTLTLKRDLFLGVDYLIIVVVAAFAALNIYLGDWLLLSTNVVIIGVCLWALRIARKRSEDEAAIITLLYLGSFICVVLLVGVHLYPAPFPIDNFVLPFLMLLLTLGAVFLPRRGNVVVLTSIVFATLVVHLALGGVDGRIQLIEAVTALTFCTIVSVAAFVFQSTRSELIRTSKEATALADARKTFLANMSHEIRTPLGAISGLIDLMGEEDENREEYLASLRASVRDLRAIVDDILDFERNSSVGIVAVPTTFAPRALIADLVRLHAAGSENVTVRDDVSHAPDQMVVADSIRIRQILRNLVNNAVKFTPDGEVVLACRRLPEIGPIEAVEFSVVDTGPGIEPERLESMFEPFVQLDSSYTKRHRGTGLGLSISRQIAKGLGGTLTAESKLGRGSTFTLTVPVGAWDASREAPGEAPRPGEAPGEAPPPARPLRILLAEDDSINALVTKRFLEKLHHAVDRVEDGSAAVERFLAQPYDVVLMDVQMPGLDGLTATQRIRALESERASGAPVPIICLTAYVSERERRQLIEAGATAVAHKPTSQDRLARAIASVV